MVLLTTGFHEFPIFKFFLRKTTTTLINKTWLDRKFGNLEFGFRNSWNHMSWRGQIIYIFFSEMERLSSRIEHLKSQNEVLTLTLTESKNHCDNLTVLIGKYESNHTGNSLSDQRNFLPIYPKYDNRFLVELLVLNMFSTCYFTSKNFERTQKFLAKFEVHIMDI